MNGSGAGRSGGPARSAEAALRSLLDELIREVTGDGVPLDANFFEAGLTSAALVRVHERLLAKLDRSLPVAALFRYPNRRALAAHLAGTAAGDGAADPHDEDGAPVPGQDPAAPPSDLMALRRQLRHRLRQRTGEA